MSPGLGRSKVPAHLFVADPDLPHYLRGRRVCARCGLLGAPGDSHHTPPVLHDGPDVRERAAGEG